MQSLARRSLLWWFSLVGVLLAVVGTTGSAHAERRIALIIGNFEYQHVPRLENPRNDASAMAALFKDAGFSAVTSTMNLEVLTFRRALADFEIQARDADVAVVYYSGHGIEVHGRNYLIPTDAKVERDVDVDDETIPLERIMQAVSGATKLKLIILDACRTDPFLAATARTKSLSRGLARVEPTENDELVAYAAEAGTVAADGVGGGNSPYTAALVQRLMIPGLDIELALRRVRDDVVQATKGQQRPFYYGSMGGAELPLKPGSAPNAQLANLPPSSPAEAPTVAAPQPKMQSRPASAQDQETSKGTLGPLYLEADRLIGDRRYKEAAEILEKASKFGDANAEVGLGVLYTTGIGGVPLDQARAFQLFKAAAAQGNSSAYGHLGISYLKGLGTSQDISEAIRYTKLGADRNDPFSLDTLGHIYEDGIGGGRPDPCKAVKLYQKSADLKSGAGLFSLAVSYVKGACVPKNMTRARQLLERSAALGNPDAAEGLQMLRARGFN